MKAFAKFLKHGWLLILLVLSFVAAGYSFYLQWHNPQQLQSVGVIASFAIAGLLALVTWVYARATEKTLDLFREQWEFQRKIGIRFGMSIREGKPWIRIVNPGGLRFMVTKAVLLVREHAPHTINTYIMVGPGEKRGFFVPLRIYEKEPHNADVNVTLHYEHTLYFLPSNRSPRLCAMALQRFSKRRLAPTCSICPFLGSRHALLILGSIGTSFVLLYLLILQCGQVLAFLNDRRIHKKI